MIITATIFQVTEKSTVTEQIAEMKEYFKAFADQNPNHRDYRPYFKVTCTYNMA